MSHKKHRHYYYSRPLFGRGFVGPYLGTAIGLGVDASIVGALPANSATPGINQGLQNFGAFLPAVGTLAGASLALGALDSFGRPLRRTKRYY